MAEKNKNELRIAAFGDVMLDRDVGEHFERQPSDFAMTEIKDLLEPVDLVFANLENPVSSTGVPHHIQKPRVTFCADPKTLCVLKNLGTDAVSLGNNHALDYGGDALSATLDHLDEQEILYAGAGRNYAEANTPLEMTSGDHKVAFLSHTFIYSASTLMARDSSPGVSDHRIGKILDRIRALRDEGQIVIVSVHWGLEYCFYPLPYQMDYARKMIDAGAHLIIGHGPHYPQGTETYKNGLIIYSLGNFVFDEPYRFANTSYIAEVGIDPEAGVTGFELHPFNIESHIPRLLKGVEKARRTRMVEMLTALYKEKDTEFWRRINRKFFRDILWRIRTMKSVKFPLLYPMRFYLNLGFWPVLVMLKQMAMKGASRRSGS